ncbi:MAG: hypothetical protein V2A73_19790, partial [Pseudomonadota bacterium]
TSQQRKLVIVSLPRGMAAGVLATLPASAGVAGTSQFPTIVFACVLATILVFAVGFPLVRRGAPPQIAIATATATATRTLTLVTSEAMSEPAPADSPADSPSESPPENAAGSPGA